MYNSNLTEDQMIKFKYITKKDMGCINIDEISEGDDPQVEPTSNIENVEVFTAIWAPNGSYYEPDHGFELDRKLIIPFSFVLDENVIIPFKEGKHNNPIKGFPSNHNSDIGINQLNDTYLLLFGYIGMDVFSEDYRSREYNFEENLDYNCQYFVLTNSGRMYKGMTPMLALRHAINWDKDYRVNPFHAMTKYRFTYRNKYIDYESYIDGETINIKEDYFALKDNARPKPTSAFITNRDIDDDIFFNKGIFADHNIDGKVAFDPTGSIIPSSVIFDIKYGKAIENKNIPKNKFIK